MVALPGIETYSEDDWAQLIKFSPISEHYRRLLDSTSDQFGDQIRLERHQAWLTCAFATFLQDMPPQTICKYWSQIADGIIDKTWNEVGLDESDIHLFALGKLGSMELNMSSDIDLMFVRQPGDPDKKNMVKVREFIRLLSEPNELGFCFRVDTDLRPGGTSAPLVPDSDSFIHFYGYMGEAWHRISLLRMRPLLGPKKVKKAVSEFARSYSFPRRLDYLIIDSMRGLLEKFHHEPGERINIKLTPGGIRDIELYVQAKQVIYGGRIDELQISDFSESIERLVDHDIIESDDGEYLQDFYWHLRNIENRLQLQGDRHTYVIDQKTLNKLGFPMTFHELNTGLEKASEIVKTFFAKEEEYQDKTGDILAESQLSPRAKQAVESIISDNKRISKSPYISRSKKKLVSRFYDHADKIDIDKEMALETFNDFISAAKSDSTIFYILNNNDEICEQLAWLFSFSPYIGRILTARPELIDSFALGSVELDSQTDDLETLLEDLQDFKLLNHLAATGYFLKSLNVWAFCDSLSESADTIASTLFNYLGQSFDTEPVDILCLGKWGGRELGTHSDLDFVFVVNREPDKEHLQLVKRFTNLVSSPSRGGTLFNIDLRLKPNERAGPLIVPMESMVEFIANKAEPWQRQAYLKSRFLKAGTSIYKSIEQSLHLEPENFTELEKILQKLLVRPSADRFDLKYSPGGLIHTEFTIQQAVLRKWPWDVGPSTAEQFEYLKSHYQLSDKIWENYSYLRKIEQLYAICTDLSTTKINRNHKSIPRIQKALREENLFENLQKLMNEQQSELKHLNDLF